MALKFGFWSNHEGAQWDAPSVHLDEDGDPLCYTIVVWPDDGTFSVCESDRDLLDNDRPRIFRSFAEAVAWCEANETRLIRERKDR